MTRVEFYFNVADKLTKVTELCDRAVAKGRQLTIFSQDGATAGLLQKMLWEYAPNSFLPSANPLDESSQFAPIIVDATGEHLIQDDILINLQAEHPPFFSRFRYLVELVGNDEADKAAARLRYKFYRDRGYQVKSTDAAAANL